MNPNTILDLRKRLSKNLKRLISNPVIEAKELAAFDLIMSRRQFLKAAQYTAIGALVASAYPPTAWGLHDPKLKVNPNDVGLTASEQLSVSIATQLVSGTELFQDTIYAEPVVSQDAVNTHGLVEGARGWSRLQSDLSSSNPDESQFLDTDFHFGPPELIQIEQDASGNYEVVHYHHPWGPRTDGARTDGLVRDVIMTEDDGLESPTKVIPVTGTFTNYFVPQGSDQQSYMTYAVFIEQDSGNHYVAIGSGLLTLSPPYDTRPDYPVQWTYRLLSDFGVKSSTTVNFSDKYTESVWKSDFDSGALAQYDPRQSHEHILLYLDDHIIIISLLDSGGTEDPNLTISHIPYPNSHQDARVIHIDWDYNDVGNIDKWAALKTIVVSRSLKHSSGDIDYKSYCLQRNDTSGGSKDFYTFSAGITYTVVTYSDTYRESEFTVSDADLTAGGGDYSADYSSLRSVNGLYTMVLNGDTYDVKLANFSGQGILALALHGVTNSSGDTHYTIFGHFPLKFPDTNGLGVINTFFGGTSKFGGLRYIACDADSNLFMMRQQSAYSDSTPYTPPIYGLYDDLGTPIPGIDTQNYDPLPTGTSSKSNLNDLKTWVMASTEGGTYESSYNILRQAVAAFGTDMTYSTQGKWLGTDYKAAYATKRFGLDSHHVVVRQMQSSNSDIYSAIAMFVNPVDKTWRQRVIANQTLPKDPGENETGDHYQATITPANAYGKPVSLTGTANANLRIEVRADSPCTVTDDTHNLYYSVDRYTSFMTTPDPASGQLNLVVKADVFSQVLYVRLVDSSQLVRSSDSAMLKASGGNIPFPWQSLNLAAQAQQRMGNDGTTTSSQLGDSAPLADTTVYISADTLSQSNTDNPWQTKGSYEPTTDNLSNLGAYLNTSGQNLISVTGQLSLGASADGVTIDPLYAGTAWPSDSTRSTVTTNFAYDTGAVSTATAPPSSTTRRFFRRGSALGSAFGSVSHDLHDALHCLQHCEDKYYTDLKTGGVTIATDANSITVTVGKDIMKMVNGVDNALNETVNTVEEYASVVVNVIVTIVKNSWIYQYIALLIALISLFIYFDDVLSLSKSFKTLFDDIFNGTNNESIPQLPSTFSSWTDAQDYLGPNNTINSVLTNLDSSSVETELTEGLLDAINSNPLTKKILNKVTAAISDVLDDDSLPLPLSFQMDSTPVQSIITQIKNLETDLVNGAANMLESTTVKLIETLAADVADPQQTYNNLASGLGPLADEIVSAALEPVFDDFVDAVSGVTETFPTYAQDMMSQKSYVTMKIPLLADLCKLFGIGTTSGSKVELSAHEAVFFPLALIVWVAVYEQEGKTTKSVDDLEKTFSTFATAPGVLGSASPTVWDFARLAVDGVLAFLLGISWAASAKQANGGNTSQADQVFIAAGAWFSWIRWINDFIYVCKFWNSFSWDFAFVAARLATSSVNVAITIPGKNLNGSGTGWPSDLRITDMTQFINALLHLVIMVIDTEQVVASPTESSSVAVAGQDFARSQVIAAFLYNLFSLNEYYEYFFAYIPSCAGGFGIQIDAMPLSATAPGSVSATAPGGSQNNHGRKRRRRRRRRPHGTAPRRIGWYR